jgi:hypothetical protein
LIATTANDTDLWLAVALSRAEPVESRVETLWTTCATAAQSLWSVAAQHLGLRREQNIRDFGPSDRYRRSHDICNPLF